MNRKRMTRSGFTLIELLAVLVILGLLVAISIPTMGNLSRASGITQGANDLQTAFTQARQLAIAKNRIIELRLYRYETPSASGEPSAGRFRATQSFSLENSPSGTISTPVTRLRVLPVNVYLASSPELSSVLDATRVEQSTGTELNQALVPVGMNYTAARIRFFPDGSTSLNVGSKSFLTLVPSITPDNITSPPANYATLLIQPLSGKIRLFRP